MEDAIYADPGPRLGPMMAIEKGGYLSCHICCDTGTRFHPYRLLQQGRVGVQRMPPPPGTIKTVLYGN